MGRVSAQRSHAIKGKMANHNEPHHRARGSHRHRKVRLTRSKIGYPVKIVTIKKGKETLFGNCFLTQCCSIMERTIKLVPGMIIAAMPVIKHELKECLNPFNLVDYPLGMGLFSSGMLGIAYESMDIEYAGKAMETMRTGDSYRFEQERENYLSGKLRYHAVFALTQQYYLTGLLFLGWKVSSIVRDLKNRAVRKA